MLYVMGTRALLDPVCPRPAGDRGRRHGEVVFTRRARETRWVRRVEPYDMLLRPLRAWTIRDPASSSSSGSKAARTPGSPPATRTPPTSTTLHSIRGMARQLGSTARRLARVLQARSNIMRASGTLGAAVQGSSLASALEARRLRRRCIPSTGLNYLAVCLEVAPI